MAEQTARQIAPAQGKLGVLCVGLGAVATTFIAGVENVRRGAARPIGSVTQMGTIRLGKRTEKRAPLIRDFVPLAALDDLVFGAWDPVPDDAYTAALQAGVLDRHEHIEPIAAFLKGIKPMPAVFDQNYVKRLEGKNVKPGTSKRELAEALRKDIRDFKTKHKCNRLVMVWCASTEIFISPGPAHWTLEAFEKAIDANDPDDRTLHALRLRRHHGEGAVRQRRAQSDLRLSRHGAARQEQGRADRGEGLQDRPDDGQDGAGSPMFKARMLGVAGLVLDQHPGQPGRRGAGRSRELQDQGGVEAGRAGVHPPAAAVSRALRQDVPQGADQLLSAPGRQQGRLGQHRHLRVAGLPDADQGRFSLPRLHSCGPAGARPRLVLRPVPARRTRAASRSGSPSTSRAPRWPPACIPSTTSSFSRPS